MEGRRENPEEDEEGNHRIGQVLTLSALVPHQKDQTKHRKVRTGKTYPARHRQDKSAKRSN